MAKVNCWELTKCGRQKGGAKVCELGVCPAAIDESYTGVNGGVNAGRICWAIAGTLCGGTVQGTYAEKRGTCMACAIYAHIRAEEGQDFVMLRSPECAKERPAGSKSASDSAPPRCRLGQSSLRRSGR